MAVSNWLMIACSLVFLNKLYSQSDTTVFDFTSFQTNEPNLIFQGGANSLNGRISLTPYLVGRVLYSPPIRLWDRAGRRQANFQTVFTAQIWGGINDFLLNGISFFVAPVNATIPLASTTGGNMGLYDATSGTSPVPLFAVELDYFANSWDPNYRHVGINIDSRNSVAFEKWEWDTTALNFSRYPWTNFLEARITYDARQRLTSAFVNATAYQPPRVPPLPTAPPLIGSVEYRYDLKANLPEWVQIGFSSASQWTAQSPKGGDHNILSWSFISFMMPDHDDVIRPDEDNSNRQYA